MLTRLLRIFLAPDELGAGGGAPTDADPAAPASGADPADSATDTNAGEGGNAAEPGAGEPPEPEIRVDPAMAKEVSRLGRLLKNAQDEHKTAQEEFDAYRQANPPRSARVDQDAVKADIMNHPGLKGLHVTEDGFVIYKGQEVSPEFAIDQWETRQKLDAHEAEKAERKLAEYEAKVDEITTDMANIADKGVTKSLKESMPMLEGRAFDTAREIVLTRCDKRLSAATGNDATRLTEELVESTAKQVLAEYREDLALAMEAQIKHNAAYKEQHKTKLDSAAGVPGPIDESKLSKGQILKLREERSRLAEAASQA